MDNVSPINIMDPMNDLSSVQYITVQKRNTHMMNGATAQTPGIMEWTDSR